MPGLCRRYLLTVLMLALLLLVGLGETTAHAATKIERVISPGGIEAWLVEDHSIPVVSMKFDFDAGASFDPPDHPGTAVMMALMLTRGAGPLDETAFQNRLRDRSIDLGFSVYDDNLYGELSTLSARSREAFDLLRLVLNEPRFDAAPFARLKQQMTARILNNRRDSDWILEQFFNKLAYGDHAYAHDHFGTPESLKALTAADLDRYRRDRLTRDTLLLSVVGDISAEQLAGQLDHIFGALPARAAPDHQVHGKVRQQARTIVIKQPVPQSKFKIVQQGMARDDPDWFAASILNYILGGGSFQSRLMKEARIKRGLTYGVYSVLRPAKLLDIMAIGGSTRNESAGEFLQLIRDQWRDFAEHGPSDEEIEQAKGYLIGSFALSMTTTSGIADVLLAIRENKLGIDYINRRSAMIEAVTRDDVMRVTRRLLTPDALRVAVVGQPVGIKADRVVEDDDHVLDVLNSLPDGS